MRRSYAVSLVALVFCAGFAVTALGQQPIASKMLSRAPGRFVFSPDSKSLAIIQDRKLVILDVKTSEIGILPYRANTVCYSDSKDLRVSGITDVVRNGRREKAVEFCELSGETMAVKHRIVVEGAYGAVSLSPDGTRLITTRTPDSTTVLVHDVKTGKLIFELKGHTARVFSAKVAPDNSYLVTGAKFGDIRFWDLKTGKQIDRWKEKSTVLDLEFAPDGKTIVLDVGYTVVVSNLATGRRLGSYEFAHSKIAVCTKTGIIACNRFEYIYFLEGGNARRFHTFRTNRNAGVTAFAFSPDGEYFAAGTADGVVKVWRTSDILGDLRDLFRNTNIKAKKGE